MVALEQPANGNDPSDDDAADRDLADLVARCIEALETEGAAAVEALLAARPDVAQDARQQLAHLGAANLLHGDTHDAAPAPADARPDFGPYEILESLGKGGMGEVFLAQQHAPVQRRVAVKVLRVGVDSKDLLARFELERHALAVMSHPNIARVFDAGTSADGKPFFVMEHVPGVALTEYCDQRRLDARARLELFVHVCDAVQHAHHKGMIHRDLKPANLLVMEADGEAVPKVIDFGVAKVVGAALDGYVAHTRLGMMVGTPEYMSPEQAARGALDIDTRTDVYALGVVLYELLSGALPFASQRLRAAGYEQMIDILRTEEPARPSTRVTPGTEHAQRVASLRATDPASLRRRLRGDLDWIVLKAMEKDRNRRYATASELGADIGRTLRDELVTARPPSPWYRLAKFARRHRLQCAAAALALAGLVLALVVTLVFSVDARRAGLAAHHARTAADRARLVAEANFEQAVEVVDAMLTRVGAKMLADVPAMEGVRRDLLARALRFHQGFVQQKGDDVHVRRRLAQAQMRMAVIHRELGEHDAAAQAHAAAITACTRVLDVAPDDAAAIRNRATAKGGLADELKNLGQRDRARLLYEEAIADLTPLCERAPDDDAAHHRLVIVTHNLALLERTSAPARAAELLRQAAAAAQALDARRPEDFAVLVIATQTELAQQASRTGDYAEAETRLRAADERGARFAAAKPDHAESQRMRASVRERLTLLYQATGRLPEAVATCRSVVATWAHLAARFPGSTEHRFRLAQAHNTLANVLHAARDKDAAEAEVRESIRRFDELIAAYPEVARYRGPLVAALRTLGVMMLGKQTQAADDEALALATRGLALEEAARRTAPARLDTLENIAVLWMQLAAVAARRGQAELGSSQLERAVAMLDLVHDQQPTVSARAALVSALVLLSQAQCSNADAKGARTTLARARDLLAATTPASASDALRHNQLQQLHEVENRACVALRDADGALAAAQAMADLAEDSADYYTAAVAFAGCVGLLPAPDATATASHPWVERAVALLRQATAGGAAGKRPAEDPDLAPLRPWPPFAALLAQFDGK